MFCRWSGAQLWSSVATDTEVHGFDSRRYQIFWEVVGLERGSLSLVNTTEALLEKEVAAPAKKTEITAVGMSSWPLGILYPHKLALTPPARGGR
jgi:hypothetical protein